MVGEEPIATVGPPQTTSLPPLPSIRSWPPSQRTLSNLELTTGIPPLTAE